MTAATTEDLLDIDETEVTPDDVDLDLVRDGLRDEEGLVRDKAASILLTFAEEDEGSVLPALPEIVDGIASDHVNVVNKTVTIAILLTDDHVDELEDAVGPLVGSLNEGLPRTQAFAAKALTPIAEDHPEWIVPHFEELLAVIQQELNDPTEGAPEPDFGDQEIAEQYQKVAQNEMKQQFLGRSVGANLLVEAAREDPGVARPHVDELRELIGAIDGTVTAALTDVLADIGENDPIAVESAVETLIDLLDHPSEQVQARAVTALGFSEDDRAIGPLRELADDVRSDDETNEDLRDLALETADWLENRSHS